MNREQTIPPDDLSSPFDPQPPVKPARVWHYHQLPRRMAHRVAFWGTVRRLLLCFSLAGMAILVEACSKSKMKPKQGPPMRLRPTEAWLRKRLLPNRDLWETASLRQQGWPKQLPAHCRIGHRETLI